MYGGDREYRYETKYGDRFIVTKHAFFDGCELRVDEPGNDFYLDLDYFDPEESVTVKSESDQIIISKIV